MEQQKNLSEEFLKQVTQRQEAVRLSAMSTILATETPPVAAAGVFVYADGSVRIRTEQVCPEVARAIYENLELLIKEIKLFKQNHCTAPKDSKVIQFPSS